MNINKSSWHYKIYRFTYSWFDEWPPQHTNLCSYVQRMFWMNLLIGVIHLMGGVIFVPWLLLVVPAALLVGKMPTGIMSDRFETYRGAFGWLYPWHVLLASMILYFEYWSWNHHRLVNGVVNLSVLAIAGIVVLGLWLFSNSETSRLTRAWLSAKKSKVCPVIEFSDSPTDSENVEEH